MTAYELEIIQATLVSQGNLIKQQADRIAELEKELKRIKFAWNLAENEIESLAPQTKRLSNEEIIKIFNQIWNDGGNTNGVMHRFAKAIEERHGIK